MDDKPQYTFKFVETVINLMESISPNTRDEVFEWAAQNDKSGIDEWRDFIVAHADNFEKIAADIDWEDDPPTDYIDAIDAYGEMVDDAAPVLQLPTKDDLLRSIEANNELARLYDEQDDLEKRRKAVVDRVLELKRKMGERP